jgi:hypothetical protein
MEERKCGFRKEGKEAIKRSRKRREKGADR